MENIEIIGNKEKRPEFLKIDHMEDGKGGSILLSVWHIVSVRYFLYGMPSQPCLELRLIDGSDVRICGEKAAKLWRDLSAVFCIWEYYGE